MRALLLFVVILVFKMQAAMAISLDYYGETSLASDLKFNNVLVGGLSGLSWQEGSAFAVSDDRGKFGEPRFYKFKLSLENKNVRFVPEQVWNIKNLPGAIQTGPALDLEGLVRLPTGEFILSSEGNNNLKPREMPRIFKISAEGSWNSEFSIADKFLPERTGQQKKGIQNNSAFEGLTGSVDGQIVYVATESALQQDIVAGQEAKGDFVRILKYERQDKTQQYENTKEFAYRVDAFTENGKGKEMFRGVSEILFLNDKQILILERGVRLFGKDLISTTAAIYLADFEGATDVRGFESLNQKAVLPLRKKKIFDFETDLEKKRSGKAVQNFEALSWGPTLPDGRKTLLVLSDDNFSKKQITELIVFAVNEASK